jgi:pyruvate dehydrogenase E2 component (dihydrolipoamide acetyltransferase)
MPKLSPTMEVGTIQEWKVAPGEAIAAGDVIAEIETDKATRSYEYQDDGFLAKVGRDASSIPSVPSMRYRCSRF